MEVSEHKLLDFNTICKFLGVQLDLGQSGACICFVTNTVYHHASKATVLLPIKRCVHIDVNHFGLQGFNLPRGIFEQKVSDLAQALVSPARQSLSTCCNMV